MGKGSLFGITLGSISAEFKEYSVSVISLDWNAVCCNGLDRSYCWVCSLGVVPFLAQS